MAANKEAMAGPDAAWLRMDHPTNLMMITSVIMFDEVFSLDELQEVIEQRLLVFDRFRQRVVEHDGTPYWERDPYFDVGRHIHRVALPAPGDQQQLQTMVSDLMTTPLDRTKPLWHVHLVENYQDGCALIWRMHHCIADGIALIQVMIAMADEYYDEKSALPAVKKPSKNGLLGQIVGPAVRAVRGVARTAETVLHESMDLLLNPSQVLDWAKQGLSLGAALSKILLMPADSDTVFKGDLGVAKEAAWSRPVPLATFKTIGEGVDGKINDVLLAAVAGALRRYLLAHDEPVEDVEIRALIPVNLRPPGDGGAPLGNRFGLVFLSLPVGIDDPEARLREVKRRMDQIKHSSEAVVALGILQALGHAPKGVEDQVVKVLSAKASAVMTNVPGPRQRLHLGGKTMRQVMFWVPRAGALSLGVSIISYAGEVMLGIASDVRLIPDPDALIAGFHAEFDALQEQFA